MNESLLTPPESGLPPVAFSDAVAAAKASLPTSLPQRPSELLFGLDIDGTLLGQRGMSDRTRSAIARAEKAGATVVIATGRGISSTRPALEAIGTRKRLTVCSNGALTVRWDLAVPGAHDVIASHDFDPRPVAARILSQLPDALLGVDHGVLGMRVSRPFPEGELPLQHEAPSLDDLLRKPVTRLVGRAPWMSRDEFASIIEELDLEDVEYAVGWTSWVDVGPRGVTKASALQDLADRFGIDHAGTITIGDGMNDIPMLAWAAFGVAMGGAEPEVEAAADAVTAPVEYDGAAAVIEAVLDQY